MRYQELIDGPFRRGEIRYWKRLLKLHDTITDVAAAAGVHRSFVYKRFEVLGIPKNKQNRGNEAWQALAEFVPACFDTRRHRPHLKRH